MNFNLSLWEKHTFAKDPHTIVLGGGIVGLNAAISLKQAEPNRDVLIIERGPYPLGASTRNAGFACFGSVTELLDDLDSNSEENVWRLVSDRIAGLDYLRKRVGDQEMSYNNCGGYEVFDSKDELESLRSRIPLLNQKIYRSTGLENTFSLVEAPYQFKDFYQVCIYNQYEGCLHPGHMMWQLNQQALDLGVRFMNGTTVDSIEELASGAIIHTSHLTLKCESLIVCTNGFTNSIAYKQPTKQPESSQDLISEINKITPARNQVLVTEPIPGLKMQSCFHYDKGYVYFRNIDDRILIGGGRNISREAEETSEFGDTKVIKEYLMDVLVNKIGIDDNIKIAYSWSGIMGIGAVKTPILRKLSEHIIFAVRLGGMGIALGSLLGDKAAKLLLNNNENQEEIRS